MKVSVKDENKIENTLLPPVELTYTLGHSTTVISRLDPVHPLLASSQTRSRTR